MNKLIFSFLSTFCFALTLSAQSWSLTGNAATTSNFLGTTNNVPLIFKVNNTIAGYIGNSGNSNVSFGY